MLYRIVAIVCVFTTVAYMLSIYTLVEAYYCSSIYKHRLTARVNRNKRKYLTPSHNDNDRRFNYDEENNDDNNEHYNSQQRRIIIQSATTAVVASTTTTLHPSSALATSSVTGSNNSNKNDGFLIPTPPTTKDISWPLGKVAFSLLPLAGTYTRRATIQQEIVKDTIWTFDQIQGIVNVNVPVRQTVIRLQNGGLWVHNPVAPTPQLLHMMEQLIQQYGPIRHIVLGTVALEHKATFAAFATNYPNATVWIQPGQWSFPFTVPLEFLGVIQRGARLREIPILSSSAEGTSKIISRQPKYSYYANLNPIPEWMNEIDYEVLGPFTFQSVGGFSETAFYHKDTKTLIVTDCVISVTNDIPPIIEEDPRALLFHSRDSSDEVILNDTPERRKKGWRHMVQFGLVFFPSQITVTPTITQAIYDDVQKVPSNLRNLGDDAIPINGALYPWTWNSNDADITNFNYISQNGKLFCPPILTKLILDREPIATLDFVNRVSTRFSDMKRIIPCHLNNNISVNGSQEFYHAFDMLRSQPNNIIPQRALAEDLALLQKASDLLTKYGIVGPSLICDGEPARRIGRFAK